MRVVRARLSARRARVPRTQARACACAHVRGARVCGARVYGARVCGARVCGACVCVRACARARVSPYTWVRARAHMDAEGVRARGLT